MGDPKMHPCVRGSVLVGVMLLAGCDLSIDATLTKPVEDGDTPNPAFDAAVDAASPGWDGSVEWDGSDGWDGSVERDGSDGWDGAVDDGSVQPDGAVAPTPCTADQDCDAQEFCSAAETCAPRCDAVHGCAGPRVERPSYGPMLSEGKRMFWATEGGQDSAGNHVSNGAIWSWDGAGPPLLVTGGLDFPTLVLAADGYLYFNDKVGTERVVFRVPSASALSAERLAWQSGDVDHAWATDSYLWWTRHVGATSELWRRARPNGSDERVKTAELGLLSDMDPRSQAARWEGGNDHMALYQKWDDYGIYTTPLGEGTSHLLAPTGGAEMAMNLVMNSDYAVYTGPGGNCNVMRMDLGSGTRKMLAVVRGPADHVCDKMAPVVWRDEWVMWLAATQPSWSSSNWTLVLGRSHIDVAHPVEYLAEIPVTVPANTWSSPLPWMLNLTGDALTYFHPGEGRLFTLEIPGYPCSEALPCPNGLTCRADQVCH